jgi:hypothetical protein
VLSLLVSEFELAVKYKNRHYADQIIIECENIYNNLCSIEDDNLFKGLMARKVMSLMCELKNRQKV